MGCDGSLGGVKYGAPYSAGNISGPKNQTLHYDRGKWGHGEESDDVQFGKIKVEGSQRAKVNCFFNIANNKW